MQALIFYTGFDRRTVIALQDLGSVPLTKVLGPVVRFDKHKHLLTIKGTSGAQVSFQIDDKTVAETADGVFQADKFEPHKGEHLRVVGQTGSGDAKAIFVRVE